MAEGGLVAAEQTWLALMSKVLTVRDVAEFEGLGLTVAAGADGLANEVAWLHVSELDDPTPFLEGGELLLTTGLGVSELNDGAARVSPPALEAWARGTRLRPGFRLLGGDPAGARRGGEHARLPRRLAAVPYEVQFVAITKAAGAQLANEQLERLTRALGVNRRLAEAVLEERGVQALLSVVSNHLGCSLALLDEARVVAERHTGGRASFEAALELPLGGGAVLKAAREGRQFGEYDRLVLHHGQTALGFELSRRRAVAQRSCNSLATCSRTSRATGSTTARPRAG